MKQWLGCRLIPSEFPRRHRIAKHHRKRMMPDGPTGLPDGLPFYSTKKPLQGMSPATAFL